MMNNLLTEVQFDLVKKHQQKLPVDVKALARELGLKVYEVANWPDDLCGKIIKDSSKGGQSGYAIYINQIHSEGRKRFTLAHEIAHFLLHKKEIGNGIADDALYRSRLGSSFEVVANKMAANILMPEKILKNKINDGYNTAEQLAGIFNVSTSAMSIRLGIPSN